MRDEFSSCHPVILFTYFVLVLLFSMFFMHPVCLGISYCSAFFYSVYLNRGKAWKFNLLYMLPVLLITALINPAFHHEGATILVYLRSGNPLTLESIVYGAAAAVMLVSIITWFSCYNKVMTSDKFIYLFGRVIPALSLIFSMVLRFVPKFKAQMQTVSNAQKCIGRDVSNGNMLERAKHGVRIMSIMITWALENAIETADSMKSRGYGLKGRTAFSIFRFDHRDKMLLTALALYGLYVLVGAYRGFFSYRYYPTLKGVQIGPYSISIFIVYACMCLLPMALNLWEDRKWKRLQSKN